MPDWVKLMSETERRLYTQKHMWVKITSEGNVRVGLSDYACDCRELRIIAHCRTEGVGEEVRAGEPFGIVETWVFMFDLYAPVSGRIRKVNKRVMDEPYVINEDPYGSGWIVEIEPTNLEKELRDLLSSGQYVQYCEQCGGDIYA